MESLNNYEKIQAFISEEVDKRLFDVRDYAVPYYEKNKVYAEILKTENTMAQSLNDVIDKWFNNQFIYSSDEDGCALLEQELNISELAGASLKDRRLNIINRLSAVNSYLSYAWLHDQFRRILDDSEFELQMSYTRYLLRITFTRLPYALYQVLKNLRRQAPANIIFEITFNKEPIEEPQYQAIVKAMYGSKTINTEGVEL